MRAAKKAEDCPAPWILDDPRPEKVVRVCAACASNEAVSLGKVNGLEVVTCRRCSSVYTPYSPWYSSEFYYDTYYWEQNLEVPKAPVTIEQQYDRVLTGYRLNESFMKSKSRRALKKVLNSVLNATRLGDSLKVFATR